MGKVGRGGWGWGECPFRLGLYMLRDGVTQSSEAVFKWNNVSASVSVCECVCVSVCECVCVCVCVCLSARVPLSVVCFTV